ncbi:MAG: HAD family hydrolase [Candidatus Saganbacteria bacterium]|nr:HAD family hydrolase [Candidatus Saganbacteria bacterium]
MNTAVFFDVDKTIIDGYTQVILVKYLLKRNEFPLTVYCQIVAWYLFYKFGITTDIIFIRDKAIKTLRGWDEEKLEGLVRECFDAHIKTRVFTEIKALIDEHIRNGEKIVLVSSSLDVIIDRLKNYLGANAVICTKLEVKNGIYTGRVVKPDIYGEAKANAIKEFAVKEGINLGASYAYSDHISDLPMLELVGNPVGVNPDMQLAKVCKRKGWEVLRFSLAEAQK